MCFCTYLTSQNDNIPEAILQFIRIFTLLKYKNINQMICSIISAGKYFFQKYIKPKIKCATQDKKNPFYQRLFSKPVLKMEKKNFTFNKKDLFFLYSTLLFSPEKLCLCIQLFVCLSLLFILQLYIMHLTLKEPWYFLRYTNIHNIHQTSASNLFLYKYNIYLATYLLFIFLFFFCTSLEKCVIFISLKNVFKY